MTTPLPTLPDSVRDLLVQLASVAAEADIWFGDEEIPDRTAEALQALSEATTSELLDLTEALPAEEVERIAQDGLALAIGRVAGMNRGSE